MFHHSLTLWQLTLLSLYALYSAYAFIRGYYQCRYLHRSFHLTPFLFPLGIFVWGDSIVFGAFWTIVTAGLLLTGDWLLFLLVFNVFWLVRSVGETIYWFNQQFSTLNRNPPEKLPGSRWFDGDAIWFVYQTIAQCVTMLSLVGTIYFAVHWIRAIY